MSKLTQYRKRINKLLPEYRRVRRTLALEIMKRQEYSKEFTNAQEAQNVLLAIANEIQVSMQKQVCDLVSRCLSAVFDEPYTFKLKFERKRNKTEARIIFIRGDLELEDPEDESGIGVLDVASFALRLAGLMLTKPKKRRLIVMDEPFKFLHSPIYLERLKTLLETLATELQVQFIIVTQLEELQIGTVVDLESIRESVGQE